MQSEKEAQVPSSSDGIYIYLYFHCTILVIEVDKWFLLCFGALYPKLLSNSLFLMFRPALLTLGAHAQ